VAALFLVPSLAIAKDTTASDRAAQVLAATGSVDVKAAGPYVSVGTFRIQVSAKLGRPSDKLADGTWLYRNFAVDGSETTGTLVVRFADGRVEQLALVTPKVATAMLEKDTQSKPSSRRSNGRVARLQKIQAAARCPQSGLF
jgi:hypothetical protein